MSARTSSARSIRSSAAFGPHAVATEIPIGIEHDIEGVVDLVDMKAYRQDSVERAGWSEIPIPDG